jgi:hypothetical protein
VSYPPEPWRLRGRLYLSVWLLPRASLPRLPPPVRPLVVAGRGLVGAAWVEYQAGSVLEYRELLSVLAIRRGARPGVSIMDIWVDSRASREGGRALWSIPKQLAEFSTGTADPGGRAGSGEAQARGAGGAAAGREWSARVGTALIAEARLAVGRRRWGRWPFRFSVTQWLGGQWLGGQWLVVSPVRGSARVHRMAAAWSVPADGPLGYLGGRRPVLSLAFRDFRMLFGNTGDRSARRRRR